MPALLASGTTDLPTDALIEGRLPGAGQAVAEALLIPSGIDHLAAHYDLTISHPALDMEPFSAFERCLGRAAARRGLTCALLHEGVIHEAIRRIEQGRLTVHFHLDYFAMWHLPDDPYARLSQAIEDAGGRPINPPARARIFTDKAAAHAELLRRGLGVPETVLFRPGSAERCLTSDERLRLRLDEPDARVYIKPANGFGHRGVVCVERTDADGLVAALAAARGYDRRDTFLLQREVRSPRLGCDDGIDRLAYWRVLYCLGDVIPFWWSKSELEFQRPSYRRLTAAESQRHGLAPMLAFTQELADLSGLDWFSTELCLSDGPEPSRYTVRAGGPSNSGRERPLVAIDYLNDQCDVDVQSRWLGAPPDGVVAYLAERFADAAERLARPVIRLDTALPLRSAA